MGGEGGRGRLAARYVENKLQNGEHIEIDETKVATALKVQADAGDVEAVRALGPMMIRGRGLAQDPQAGIALLRRAAEHDVSVEYQIADLYLIGTNGLPHDHEEAMKWFIGQPRQSPRDGDARRLVGERADDRLRRCACGEWILYLSFLRMTSVGPLPKELNRKSAIRLVTCCGRKEIVRFTQSARCSGHSAAAFDPSQT